MYSLYILLSFYLRFYLGSWNLFMLRYSDNKIFILCIIYICYTLYSLFRVKRLNLITWECEFVMNRKSTGLSFQYIWIANRLLKWTVLLMSDADYTIIGIMDGWHGTMSNQHYYFINAVFNQSWQILCILGKIY